MGLGLALALAAGKIGGGGVALCGILGMGDGVRSCPAWGLGGGLRSSSGGDSDGGGSPRSGCGLSRIGLGLGSRRPMGPGWGGGLPELPLSSVTSSLNPAWQSLTHRRDAQGRQGDLEVQLLP